MKLATVLRELARPEEERAPDYDFDLIRELNEYLVTKEAQGVRSSGSFNPSGLEGCKRALAYNYLKAPVNEVNHDPRLMITFELGHYIHERFQDIFTRMAKRKGWDFIPEMRIIRTLNPWFVSGRCDGLFVLPTGKEAIEIKSIHKDGFNRLFDRPLYEHQYQGNCYQGLLKVNRMHYLYICKDNSQIKTFVVPFDRELFNSTMGKIERILLKLQDWRLPKRITPDCRDKKCKFLSVCWDESQTVERLLTDETRKELEEWKPVIFHRSARKAA
jgi:hypothetical protein